MIFGLIGAVFIMLVEMSLFIIRAIKMESAYERVPTTSAEAIAQLRSGSLLTATNPKILQMKRDKNNNNTVSSISTSISTSNHKDQTTINKNLLTHRIKHSVPLADGSLEEEILLGVAADTHSSSYNSNDILDEKDD
jgi:hypothetical protein